MEITIKQRILNEMVETEEEQIVRELKTIDFPEDYIRKRYKELSTLRN